MSEVAAEGVDAELLAWCVVANVAAETAHGPGGQESRQGLKHFAPGAKVWVLPPQSMHRVDRLIKELLATPDDLVPVAGGLLRDQVEAAALADLLGHRHWPRIAIAARVAHTMPTTQG
ncbi:hypothetical protein [Crossiella cryophila]|uniref:Uncharacterized protein n=1 Tax=Crossiella cryophila TaxID=43355 RepID=A0A7W7FWP1_9PSEU|nr:hypothetical protein [Crossiella cryophila]MBB4680255.1 hypothetical protein [Crossiella cryophila]